MKSFLDVERTFANQPTRVSVLLSTIDQGRGREELFADQRPQLLAKLSEDARVESITASNAIEGINVAQKRAEAIAAGRVTFRNRTEKEFAGYRDALDGLMRSAPEPMTVPLIMHLHRTLLKHIDGRGGHFKSEPNEVISREGGRTVVTLKPPAPEETEFLTRELIERYATAQHEQAAHPMLLIAALALDLLAIHPFADGNGRTTRLVTNSELLFRGFGVARYVSIEQRIFESKNTYYASLYQSQRQWVETQGEHNIWPWATYFVELLAESYTDFEARFAAAGSLDGLSKQQQVEEWVRRQAPLAFSLSAAESALPGVSRSTLMVVLNRMKAAGEIEVGRGRSAMWTRKSGP